MPDLRWFRDGVLPYGDGTAGPVGEPDDLPEIADPPGEPVGLAGPWGRACREAAWFRLLSADAQERLRRRACVDVNRGGCPKEQGVPS